MSTESVASWVNDFANEALSETGVQRFVEAVDSQVLREIPALASDPQLVQDLHRSTAAHWRAFVASNVNEPDHVFVLPSQAVDLALDMARRGYELADLLKIYRIGSRTVLDYFSHLTADIRDPGVPRDEVLVHMWGRAGRWIEDATEKLIQIYYDERQRLHAGARARRSVVIEALVAGNSVDTHEAGALLRYPLHAWHTAVIAWSDPADTVDVDQVVAGMGAAVTATLVHAPAPNSGWAWLATETDPGPDFRAKLLAQAAASGAHVAVGVVRQGVVGFRMSHLQAHAAQDIAIVSGASGLVDYEQVDLLCLMTGGPDLMADFVRAEAGPLCLGDRTHVLRETVLAFYEAGMNTDAAARALFVHRNTVRYRLDQAQALLGRPLSERVAQLHIALRHVATYGPPSGP